MRPRILLTLFAIAALAALPIEPRAGTLTVVEHAPLARTDAAPLSVPAALATAAAGTRPSAAEDPVFVRGVLLMDVNGDIWMCDNFAHGGSSLACEDPMLRVLGYPRMEDWDLANADIDEAGLLQALGVRFFLEADLVGIVSR